MDKVPTEIWSYIFYHACNDTGLTGHSLSQTSRYVYTLSKPFRFRSVVVRGIPQLIGFCRALELTLEQDRVVENLFLSTYEPNFEYLKPNPRYKLALVEFYKPGVDPRQFQPSPEEIVDEYEELVIHCLMRILLLVAPTVKNLHISCTHDRVFLLPPIQLPEVVNLTMAGSYTSILKASNELSPIFPKLRRLRLSDIYIGVGSMLYTTLSEQCPNITHLRLEPDNPETEGFKSEVEKILNYPQKRADVQVINPDSTPSFPHTLEKLIIHPGYSEDYGGCGTSFALKFASKMALKRLLEDPRVTLYNEYPRSRPDDADEEREQVDSWLLFLSGRKSFWDPDQI